MPILRNYLLYGEKNVSLFSRFWSGLVTALVKELVKMLFTALVKEFERID